MQHADKPPIEELHQFLDYQLPRQWAPEFGDLPLGLGSGHRKNMSPWLRFTLTGPKLYVNTTKVINAFNDKSHHSPFSVADFDND